LRARLRRRAGLGPLAGEMLLPPTLCPVHAFP
jgi:hypothetical protein